MGNIIISLIFFAIGVPYYQSASGLESSQFDVLGAGGYPKMISLVFLLLNAIYFVSAVKEYKTSTKRNVDFKEYKYVLITAFSTLLYVLLINYIGFLLSCILYIFFVMSVLGEKNRRRNYAVFSVLFSISIFFFFMNSLGVYFPIGKLFETIF